MFNCIIFDIDNTIFDYDNSNNIALKKLFNYISEKNNLDIDFIKNIYEKNKKKYKNESGNTASSHSKYIQIKKMIKALNLSLNENDEYFEIYNNFFIKNLVVYPNIEDFLIFCKSKNIKLYCLSNNTCKEQIERLKSAKLLNFFDNIYTSEEFGIEKPDSKLFYSIIDKINYNKNEIAMIGDSFNNDILGCNSINIYGFWLNKKFEINKEFTQFDSYKNLLIFFKSYYFNAEIYCKLSRYVGERFDLVQAGGGNTSFKDNNFMFIKSSGCCLSDLKINKNYVGINYVGLKNNLNKINFDNKKEKEKYAQKLVNKSVFFLKNYKPSIESTMHSLTKKLTVHLHPIQFNLISGLPNCEDIINCIFNESCFINYFTPGIDVALELKKKYKNEKIIFLKNHGIVFTTDDINSMYKLIESTISKLEDFLKKDFTKYKLTNKISMEMESINKSIFVSYLSEDMIINKIINNISKDNIFKSFFPDKLVYCGNDYININKDLNELIKEYIDKNEEIPKIFIKTYNKINYLYISSNSLKKCIEIESVLKSHLICYNPKNEILLNNEIKYLNNWDAEIYRKSK